MTKTSSIDEYISNYPANIQKKLKEIRKIIKSEIKNGEESISYGLPTFKYKGKGVVYFGASKNHLGFYPFPSGIKEFKNLSDNYKTSKGTIHFPYDEKLPVNLIKRITKFRLKEIQDKLKNNKKGK